MSTEQLMVPLDIQNEANKLYTHSNAIYEVNANVLTSSKKEAYITGAMSEKVKFQKFLDDCWLNSVYDKWLKGSNNK